MILGRQGLGGRHRKTWDSPRIGSHIRLRQRHLLLPGGDAHHHAVIGHAIALHDPMGGVGGGPDVRTESAEQSQTLGRRIGHFERQSGQYRGMAARGLPIPGSLALRQIMRTNLKRPHEGQQRRGKTNRMGVHGVAMGDGSANTRKNRHGVDAFKPSSFQVQGKAVGKNCPRSLHEFKLVDACKR